MPQEQYSALAAELVREFGQLVADRGTWEAHWREIAERVLPAYVDTFNAYGVITPGRKRTELIYDSTAPIALGRFAAVVDSLLTPANQKWHKLVASDRTLNRIRNVRVWFEDVTDILFKYREAPEANFRSQNHENYRMLGAFGTGAMYTDALAGSPGLRYRAMHLGEIYFAENHQGIVDQAWRWFKYTGRQIAQRWPDSIPEKIKVTLERTPHKEWQVLHCVKSRTQFDPQRKDYRGMPFASYYIAADCKEMLEEGGYRSFPYSITRYWQAPREIYGRSPGMDALPAIKTLNEEKKTVLKQGHRIVDPVLLMPDDGVLDNFSLKPGAQNHGAIDAQGRKLVDVLPTGNIAIGKDLMDDERAVINDAFLVTLFQILVETPQMTATEVLERVKEKGMLLSPTVGRQQSEYLGPLISRELDVLSQQGLLPPMPQELIDAQGEYTVEYEGPMARAQRAEEASGAMRSIESTLAVVNVTQDPSPLDHYDFDIIVPEIAEIQGTPLRWMRSMDKIQELRDQRAQQAEQQQAVEAAPAAAGLIKATQGKGA